MAESSKDFQGAATKLKVTETVTKTIEKMEDADIREGKSSDETSVLPLSEPGATQERVIEIICKQLDVSREEVTLETSFIEDLGADSLDIVELVIEIEEEYNTEISDDDVEEIRTVKDVIAYIDSRQMEVKRPIEL